MRTKDGKPIVLFYNDLAGAINTANFEGIHFAIMTVN